MRKQEKIWLALLINWGLEIPFLLNWGHLVPFLFFSFQNSCCTLPIFNLYLVSLLKPFSSSVLRFSLETTPWCGWSSFPMYLQIWITGWKAAVYSTFAMYYMYCFFIQTHNFWGISEGRCTSFLWDCLFQWQACHWFGKVVSDSCKAELGLKRLCWSRGHHGCPQLGLSARCVCESTIVFVLL